ncbi:hypothetical protein MKX07_003682 [Trichoderma sp. CBMAI-0711]|nr:hypothetical protein MKX07_003682 [Trichoderma sp. CBMAI-0711]
MDEASAMPYLRFFFFFRSAFIVTVAIGFYVIHITVVVLGRGATCSVVCFRNFVHSRSLLVLSNGKLESLGRLLDVFYKLPLGPRQCKGIVHKKLNV